MFFFLTPQESRSKQMKINSQTKIQDNKICSDEIDIKSLVTKLKKTSRNEKNQKKTN